MFRSISLKSFLLQNTYRYGDEKCILSKYSGIFSSSVSKCEGIVEGNLIYLQSLNDLQYCLASLSISFGYFLDELPLESAYALLGEVSFQYTFEVRLFAMSIADFSSCITFI